MCAVHFLFRNGFIVQHQAPLFNRTGTCKYGNAGDVVGGDLLFIPFKNFVDRYAALRPVLSLAMLSHRKFRDNTTLAFLCDRFHSGLDRAVLWT